MQIRKSLLVSVALGVCALGYSQPSFAVGAGGFGANVPVDTVTIKDMGPLSGKWQFSGGIDGSMAAFTNATPRLFSNVGGISPNLQYSMGLAAIQIHKGDGWLHFTYWGGAWQTPATGITSDAGAFNSLDRFGSGGNPIPGSPTFKWWLTVQPSQYWSISGGEMPSLEGTEIGFDWMNPTPLVSNLNNMQVTPAYGPQLNFFYGPASLNLQWSDSYHTGRHNVLSYLVTYNLNASGSDNVIAFGHTNLGHTGNPGPNFAEQNSSLIGFGAQWVWGPWTFSPEAEYQWLPKSSVQAGNASGAAPQTTYYNVAAMFDLTYAITNKWSLTVQPQIVYQNGDKSDPNAQTYGNWLQFGLPAAPGVFSPGTTFTSLQICPTWDNNNFFIRPDVDFTNVAGFAPGTGWGKNGTDSSQIVGLVEVGYLFGK